MSALYTCRNCNNTGNAWYGGLCPCVKQTRYVMVNQPPLIQLGENQEIQISAPIDQEPNYISISHWGLHAL